MILTVQQKFMLTAIQSLGCVREDQLVTLFRPAFCAERPDAAERVAGCTACDAVASRYAKRTASGT